METSVLITIIATLNLIVVFMMFLLLGKELRKRDNHNSADTENFRSANNAILEKIGKLEKQIGEQIQEKPRFAEREVNTPANRVKTALEKLNSGISPDLVCRDLGYSRSEMGILLASARHGKTVENT
ncbi:MAG: hypothetical protein V3W18_08180 [candidate division Zixibacteria bacterium]